MIPSDALQLLYYYQLVKEWVTGATPLFYNLYEFNTGDDAERYFPGGYYAPFSLFYALGAALAGKAFGLNLTVIFSLWLTMLATWLLLRRYVKDEWIVALFSIFVLVFPYRWISIFDSSPTGFAMMWVPVLFLGLDMAVRDGRLAGGLLAGVTLLLVYVGDVHVFFFSVLATPAWCLLALVKDSSMPHPWPARMLKIAQALLPVAAAAILIFLVVKFLTAALGDTHMADGRNLGEVALFSPTKDGFLQWRAHGIAGQIHLGWALAGLVLCGFMAMLWHVWRSPRQEWLNLLFWMLLVTGTAVVGILALGPHGLRHGGLFSLVRELIPPYAMIRQAGKIFCLMPTLLAVAGALALSALVRVGEHKTWWRAACLTLAGVPLILGYISLSAPALTFLRDDQGAYQAVADDARAQGREPHALVVVLWPGDSHFASLYQHYALVHRVRIVNGYSPAYTRAYFEDVFLRYHLINQGYLDDGRIEDLLDMGVGHILLHEDLYPEKVAPFPVAFAIKEFLHHPRLRFLGQDGSVWAFRILDRHEESVAGLYPTTHDWTSFFPARHWEMERSRQDGAEVVADPLASGGMYVSLVEADASVTLPPAGVPPAPGLRWMVRLRGEGRVLARIYSDQAGPVSEQELTVRRQDWEWMEVGASRPAYENMTLQLRLLEGAVDIDSALLAAGTWSFLEPGQSMTLPAPLFFHAGYTDLDHGHLVFRKDHEPRRIIFYGPKMPFSPGLYDVSLSFAADAPEGTVLGMLHLETDWNSRQGEGHPVVAGRPFQAVMELADNLPLNSSFVFFGQGDMTVDSVVFTRVQ